MLYDGLIAVVDWRTGRLIWPPSRAVKISQRGINAIKAHEGLRLEAYPDPASGGEPWTIGHGHTKGVRQGQYITATQAEDYLRQDLSWVEAAIRDTVRVPLNQGQYDAICSLIFNIGGGAFGRSTLLKRLNDGDYKAAAAEFMRFDMAAGKRMPGLTRRREAEMAMFSAEQPAGAPIAPSPIPAQPVETVAPPATPIPTIRDFRTVPAGEAPDYPEKPMLPALLVGLATSLIDAFSPLAREKVRKELARHGASTEVADQVYTAVLETAKTATGKADPIAATATAIADPAVMVQAEDSALATLDRLAPLLDKLHQWDKDSLAADAMAMAQARQYNAEEPFVIDTPWLRLKFIHVLSIAFVSFSAWFVTLNWLSLTPELRGAVITLMIIAGWNGVRDYWMSSSRGSAAKDVVIGELSRRKQ